MLLPEIRLLLGTTYRDLHTEREYLLKRTFPHLKRECEQKGILVSIREVKWAQQPNIVASQLNELVENLHDESTIYLSLTTPLQPAALPPMVVANVDPDSLISREFGPMAIKMLTDGASWQELERNLAMAILPVSQRIIVSCATDTNMRDVSVEALGDEIGAEVLHFAATRYGEALASPNAENHHRLYLRSRTIDSLQSASCANELLLALQDAQQVVLVGTSGSGKSTTLGLAIDALSITGSRAIPYVLEGNEGSSRAIARYINQTLDQGRSTGSADPHTDLSLALSRSGEVVIAIDGIEYLDQRSRYLGWLPHPLPKNIRVIATTSESEQGAALSAKGWKVINVSALSPSLVTELVEHLCRRRNLWLTVEQQSLICEHPLAFHPQFLITLCDELGQFGWFAQLNKNLDEYLDEVSIYQLFNSSTGEQSSDTSLPSSFILSARLQHYLQSHSLVEMFQKVLERLEFDLGIPQLTRVLGYVASSHFGLRHDDLATLTGLRIESIQHLIYALGANLVTRQDRILIGNENFAKAVHARYLGSASVRQAVRTSLVHHLRRAGVVRNATELAAQFHAANDPSSLRELLLDPAAMSSLLSALQHDTLARYWQMAQTQVSDHSEYDLESAYLDHARTLGLQRSDGGRVPFLRQLAEFLLYLGRSEAAREILESALEVTQKQSEMKVEGAAILRSLGKTHYLLARYLDSEKAYRQSMLLFTECGPHAEAEVLISKEDLAQLLAEGARYTEAEQLYNAILKETEQRYGATSPESASALSSIGFMFNGQGRYDEAIRTAQQAKDIYVHHWGSEYPELGWCYHTLATAYRQKNELNEAEQWYSLAIDRFVQMFGEEHPTPLRSMYGLAVLYQRKGDIEAAIAQTRKVLALRERLLGSSHADTAAVKVLLGSLLRAMDRYEESVVLLSDALSIFDAGANKEHPEVARTLHELGDVYAQLKQPERARSYLRRALTIRTKVLGNEHPDTLATQVLLSGLAPSESEHAVS